MAEREIVAVVWHEHTRTIDMVYEDGHPDTLMGTKKMAAQMAEGFGLDLCPTPTGPSCGSKAGPVATRPGPGGIPWSAQVEPR